MGMPAKDALELATDFYDQAMSHATSADGKVFSLDKFVDQRNQQLHDLQSQYKKFGLQEGPIFQAKLDKNTGMYVSGGKGRSQSHRRLLKGIGPILNLISKSDAFDANSKRYLARLGLDAIVDRSFARAHYKRMKSLPFQGREFLFQAVPTPREVNDFFALTEQKRYGQDLMVPKKSGRGGADSYMSNIIRETGKAPFGKRFSATDLFLGARSAGTPLQKLLMQAMVRAYATAPAKNAGGPIRGYNKGGGVVRKGRHAYGERFRTRYDSMTGKHIITDVPDGFSPAYLGQSVSPAELDQLRLQAGTKYSPASNTPRSGAGLMMGSMALSMGAYQAGVSLSGGNQMVGFGASIAGEIAGYHLLNKMLNKTGQNAAEAASKGSLVQRAFAISARIPGWGKLLAVVIGLGLGIKKVNDAINNHRKTVSLAFGPSADVVEKLNLKFTTLNDQLEAAQARMEAFKESGGALYSAYTSAGIPGVTLSIKQLKELKERVTQDFPELIQMFNQAAGSEVTAKAESLKAQFVAGGMSVQEATNLVYALVSASNKATFALRAIASEGFRSIKDEASAATSSIKTFFNLLNAGNTDQLVAAFDTVLNALQAAEQKLIGLTIDQYGVVDAAEAYQITLERINSSQGANTKLTGDQLEALKAQNPLLYTILGTSETLASVFAKMRMYSMGITLDFTKLDPKVAENLSTAIMKMDNFYRTDTSKDNPFASLVVEINKAKEQAAAADAQTIKNAEQKKEDLEDLIELKQKEIDAIREEADARRRALEEQQQDEDILLQIKKKQLEYNNAMASGDVVTAAQAQLDIQRLVGQQQVDLAKRAIDEKERKDVDAKEAEIEALRNRIKGLEDTVEAAQETAKAGAEDLARLQDLLGRGIQAIMMGQGGYDKYEKGIVKGLIEELKKESNPQIKAIVPLLEAQLNDPSKTQFEDDLVDTLKSLNITMQDIRDRYLPPIGTKQKDEVPNKSWWQKTVDWIAKAAVTAFGSPSFGFSGGGYIKGPGTGTSDSIPGYITGFADGGAVPIRVSNTEYITRANSVKDITVPNMDLINERGAEGVVMAAQNILGVNAATGGYVNKLVNYAMGSTGGLPKIAPQKKFNFNKLDDRMLYAMKHLVSKGMTAEAAAGIVGNLIAESTLRTGAMEAGHTREGRGIAQWGVNARWKTYQNWLKKNGRKDIYDLANQLDFIWWEMHNGQLQDPKKFKTLTNISRAAYLFMDQYERPGVLRWKERNTWAYKAYKHFTGKDYVDVAGTLYPGPDQAKSDYAKGLNKPSMEMLPEDPEKLINLMIIPGVSKVSALGFKDGGSLNPLINNRKPGVPYTRSGRPIGSPHGRYWGELERLYQQSPIGFDKNGKPIFNNQGKDPWGGTEIPGLKFTGNIPQYSDYWHQMAEQPKKPYRGPGLGLDKDPERYAGSGASMGGIGNGAYGLGPLMFANGGMVSSAPHSMGMRSQGTVKKLNWFQNTSEKILNVMGKGLEKSNPILYHLMMKDLIRRYSEVLKGSGTKGDFANLAVAAIPFGGFGGSAAKVPGVISKLTPEMKSFQMADIDAKAMNALKNIDPSSIKIPETGISFSPSAAKAALQGWKQEGSPVGATAWEIVQAQREALLKAKYPKIDFSDVAKFNEYYAKEFYGLLPDESIKLFKGVRSTVGSAWRTGEKDLSTYFSTNPYIAALYSAMLGKSKLGDELPMFGIDRRISDLRNFLGEGSIRNGNAQGSMEFPQLLRGKDLSDVLPSIYSLPGQVYGQIFGGAATSLTKIKNLWPSGFANGGYLGKIRKFHDWNGAVPGNYGQEVGAILQAGREGVYDTDYVNALRNGTMSTSTNNSKTINVGSVQMTFTEPVTNGKQIFNEFKALLSFESNASNSNMNLGVGA
jgi:hypothetical protein